MYNRSFLFYEGRPVRELRKERLFAVVSARFDLNVIYELECKDGRVFAKERPDCGVTFGEAVALVQKAGRGEPVVERGYIYPQGVNAW